MTFQNTDPQTPQPHSRVGAIVALVIGATLTISGLGRRSPMSQPAR